MEFSVRCEESWHSAFPSGQASPISTRFNCSLAGNNSSQKGSTVDRPAELVGVVGGEEEEKGCSELSATYITTSAHVRIVEFELVLGLGLVLVLVLVLLLLMISSCVHVLNGVSFRQKCPKGVKMEKEKEGLDN
jgi:hypothetical protein